MARDPASHYVDLPILVAAQRQERYRSLLILGESARERSQQARRLAKRTNIHYLNLLDYFEARPELCEMIDIFDLDKLEQLLLGLDVQEEVVVVDAIDFLLNTWLPERRQDFVWLLLGQRLDTYERGAKTFVFFALEDVYLRQHDLQTSKGQPRIFRLTEVRT
jgi:hypothetical protein